MKRALAISSLTGPDATQRGFIGPQSWALETSSAVIGGGGNGDKVPVLIPPGVEAPIATLAVSVAQFNINASHAFYSTLYTAWHSISSALKLRQRLATASSSPSGSKHAVPTPSAIASKASHEFAPVVIRNESGWALKAWCATTGEDSSIDSDDGSLRAFGDHSSSPLPPGHEAPL